MNEIGCSTHHTRVERQECDYNDHWNVRYYARSFQMAAEAVAAVPGKISPGAGIICHRHMRFHRELFVSASVEMRSSTLESGPLAGAIVHLLTSADGVAATALDFPGGAECLPPVSPDLVQMALPRGLAAEPIGEWPEGGASEVNVNLGPIRPMGLDHTGELLFEEVMRLNSIASHVQLNRIGLTPEFSNRTGINRMGIEFLVSRKPTPPVGTPLRGQSKLMHVKGKNFWTIHRIVTATNETVATIEQCLVTVDLNTRSAVEVPEFLHTALDQASLS